MGLISRVSSRTYRCPAPHRPTKKAKKPPRGAVRVQNGDADSDEDHLAKMAAQMRLDEQNSSGKSSPMPGVGKKGKKGKKGKQQVVQESESEDELAKLQAEMEAEEAARGSKKAGGKGKKQG